MDHLLFFLLVYLTGFGLGWVCAATHFYGKALERAKEQLRDISTRLHEDE